MFKSKISSRFSVGRFLFIVIAAAGFLSLTVGSAAAAPFSIIDSVAQFLGLEAPTNSCTSAASGSWGDPATWTGCGGSFPGPGDNITITNGKTVTLDATRAANNVTINGGGTLDLNGQQFSMLNANTTLTNNGTLANTAGFNYFYLQGDGNSGGITMNLAGAGTYSSNILIRVYNGVKVSVAASTSVTYPIASNTNNFQIDGSSILDLTNALTFIAPSSGANYVGITNNQTVSGAGGLKVQGNVTIAANTGAGSFTAPVEIVSGAANGYGTFTGAFKIDSPASFTLGTTTNWYGNLTIPSGATLDLNGQAGQMAGNGTTFTNNGVLTNTAAYNYMFFTGDGTSGDITLTFAGAGTYSPNLLLRVYNGVKLIVAPSTSITYPTAINQNNFQVDGSSILDLTNPLNFTAPSSGAAYVGFTNNQTVSGAGGLKMHGNVTIIGNAGAGSFTAPLEFVSGAANGYGSFTGSFKVDSNASFQTLSTLNLYGDLTIQSNASIDMNGQAVQFFGDSKTFSNNGTLTDSAAGNAFYFYGNGSDGMPPNPPRIAQSVTGAGNYGSSVQLRVYNTVILSTASAPSFNGLLNLQIDGSSTLNLTSPLTFTGPAAPSTTFATITNSGLVQGSALKTQGNVYIIGNATFSAPIEVVNGTSQIYGSFSGAFQVDNTATLFLTATLNLYASLTNQSGGTIDLNGQAAFFLGNNTTFTNNGLLTNTQAFNAFYFYGNGTAGGITQTFAGAGTYNANAEVHVYNAVNLSVAPSTSMTFSNAANQVNLQVDSSSTLDLTNALNFTAPSSGAAYVGITNGQTVTGAGGLKVHGNVNVIGNTPTFTSPLEIVSGAAAGYGTFNGAFKIDSTGSFILGSTLSLYGDLNIATNATLDVNGQASYFLGDGKTFANNGTVLNSAGGNTLYFYGNGTAGGVTQHFATSAGSFTDNLVEHAYNAVTVILDGDVQLGYLQIDGGSTMDITNRTLKLSGAGNPLTEAGTIITPGSTIELDGTAAQSVQTNLNGAAFNNLTINNAAGVDIPNPGANPLTIPGTLTLTKGIFTLNSNLTMGNGATIARSAGSLAAAPIFGSTTNILYFGTGAIASALEIPPSHTINNLTDNNTNTVTLSSTITVNGNALIGAGATLTGAGGTTLNFAGANFTNNGNENHPNTVFNTGSQSVAGTGAWTGAAFQTTSPSNTSLANSITFSNTSFTVNGGSTVATGANTLTFNGGSFVNSGGVGGQVKTTGPSVSLNAGASGFSASLDVNSGTTSAQGIVNSTLTVDATATALQVPSSQVLAVGATSTTNAPLSGAGTFRFNGAVFTNNATVSVAVFQFGGGAQSLAGTGSFIGNTATILGGSTTTLSVNKQMSTVGVAATGTFNFASRTLFLSGVGNAFSSSGSLVSTGSTVEFNGSSAQAPTVASYVNVTGNNPTTVTMPAATSASGLTKAGTGTLTFSTGTVNNVQVDIPGTLTGSSTLSVQGNWTNNGTFTPSTSTVSFTGSGAQSIGGSNPTTFNNLTIANSASGVSLATNATVNGILTLTNDLGTGANTLTMPAAGTSAGAGDVIGNVKRTGFTGGGAALSFGNPFTTIKFAVGGTLPSDVTVNLVKAIPSGAMSFTNAIQRTYTITPTGGSGFSSTLRLHYLDAELNGNAEAGLKLWRFGGSWVQQGVTANDAAANWAELSGITQFSPWTLSSAAPTPSPTATFTATSTATNTPTSTPTNTPTPTGVISGTVTYGNAIPAATRFVSHTLMTATGSSPPAPVFTDGLGATAGQYSLTGFGSGAYTVTPTKTGAQNGFLTSFDAAKIAQHAAGTSLLTGNQLIVADVSGTNGITSFDAAEVARWVAGFSTQVGQTGNWIFQPVNRNYASVTTNQSGQDYSALLMGEVSGNWVNNGTRPARTGPERNTAVALPQLVTPADSEVLIPIRVEGATDKGIISYEFDLRYDASVIQPQANPVDMAGTVSSKLSVVANAEEAGLLRVVVYGAMPINGNGLLMNLKFTSVGSAGSVSPLTWERLMINEGDPMAVVTDGQVELSAAAPNQAEISGRLLTAMGQGVANARVTLTDTTGQSRSVLSNGFGVYRFGGLQVGQTYTVSVDTKRYAFAPVTVSVTGQLMSTDMIAEQ